MLTEERFTRILSILESMGSVTVQQLMTELDASELRRVLNGFLRRQSAEARVFFLRRYWYGESIREIAEECCVSEAKVKTSLFRTRERLRTELEQERIRL